MIHFRFINGVEERSAVLARKPPRLFGLRYFGSTVRFDIVPDGEEGSDVTMTNTEYDPNDREMLMAGWLNVLLPLKAWLDHGVDLHNHDANRSWDQKYVDY